MYFPYYLPTRKYAWKTLQKWFFCKFLKTSETTAYLQKKVCRNPPRSSRCRYDCRKKWKMERQKFFWFAFGGTICNDVFLSFNTIKFFEKLVKFFSKFDELKDLEFSHMWKVNQHRFFRIFLTTTRKLFHRKKTFNHLDKNQKSDHIRFFHLIVAGIVPPEQKTSFLSVICCDLCGGVGKS